MLLAGDVGGTKTLLGLFAAGGGRPQPVAVHTYTTADFGSFTSMLDAFARDANRATAPLSAAAFGVAGPVVSGVARLTNVPWNISVDQIAAWLRTSRVALLNDLEAMATAVDALTSDELVVLQEGVPEPHGNAAVIAAGTGLGQAYLHRIGGRFHPVPSEGGHADFAARSDREFELVRMLRELYGRAEVEHVLSGPGLLNLFRFTHRGGRCAVIDTLDEAAAPARVSQAALAGRCQSCADALQMFVSVFGAEAGNLALRGVATAGLFIGGGIAPKVLPAIQSGTFMDAFRDKPPMVDLLSRIPVRVILNPDAGLLGAAVHAQELAQRLAG